MFRFKHSIVAAVAAAGTAGNGALAIHVAAKEQRYKSELEEITTVYTKTMTKENEAMVIRDQKEVIKKLSNNLENENDTLMTVNGVLNIIKIFESAPLTKDEIGRGIEAVVTPDTLTTIDPNNTRSVSKIAASMRTIMNRPDIVAMSIQNLEEINYLRDFKPTVICNVVNKLERRLPNSTAEWDRLKSKYLCTICDNVLASPNIIPTCSHSFCGVCIADKMNICQEVSFFGLVKSSIAHHCPGVNCQNTYDEVRYQRAFDDLIYQQAMKLADCEQKREFLRKRALFQERLHEEKNETKQAQKEGKDLKEDREELTILTVLVVIVLVFVYRGRIFAQK